MRSSAPEPDGQEFLGTWCPPPLAEPRPGSPSNLAGCASHLPHSPAPNCLHVILKAAEGWQRIPRGCLIHFQEGNRHYPFKGQREPLFTGAFPPHPFLLHPGFTFWEKWGCSTCTAACGRVEGAWEPQWTPHKPSTKDHVTTGICTLTQIICLLQSLNTLCIRNSLKDKVRSFY